VERRCGTATPRCSMGRSRRKLFKDTKRRGASHYDSLPHGNCFDAARCDCECRGCLEAWDRENQPGPNSCVIPFWAAYGYRDAYAAIQDGKEP